MCFVWIGEKKRLFSYKALTDLLVTEADCIYRAVRTGSLNKLSLISVFTAEARGSTPDQTK